MKAWEIIGFVVLWSTLLATGLWIFVAFYWGWKSAKPTDGLFVVYSWETEASELR